MTQPPTPEPSQQPTPQWQYGAPSPAVPAPPPAAPRRRAAVVLAAVAGLLLGAAGVGCAWLLTSASGGEGGAAADAALACELVARTPGITMSEDDLSDMHRWGAAWTLAMAAAETDPSYEQLAKALQKPIAVVQQTFEPSGPEYEEAIRDARAACANL